MRAKMPPGKAMWGVSMAESIICPKCSFEIEVSTALAAQLRDQLRKEFEADARRKDQEIVQREQQIRLREQEIDTSRQSIEAEVLKRLGAERLQLMQDAKTKAQESIVAEVAELQGQLTETRDKLGLAQKTELQIRKDRRELEDQKNALELTI
jgi:hypothetical protein